MTPVSAAIICGSLVFCAVMLTSIQLRLGAIYRALQRLHACEDARKP
jgi:hypothetical protein